MRFLNDSNDKFSACGKANIFSRPMLSGRDSEHQINNYVSEVDREHPERYLYYPPRDNKGIYLSRARVKGEELHSTDNKK